MSFGSMNTSDSEAFRNKVYSTMTADAGMQLLLYKIGMWSSSGWQVDADAEPALRGACNELADYLSRAVNGEKVKSASSTLMHTMAGQALVDALNAPVSYTHLDVYKRQAASCRRLWTRDTLLTIPHGDVTNRKVRRKNALWPVHWS